MGDEKAAGVKSVEQLNAETQRLIEQYKRTMEMISNIMKSMHDRAQQIINNTRG